MRKSLLSITLLIGMTVSNIASAQIGSLAQVEAEYDQMLSWMPGTSTLEHMLLAAIGGVALMWLGLLLIPRLRRVGSCLDASLSVDFAIGIVCWMSFFFFPVGFFFVGRAYFRAATLHGQ